MVLVRLDYGVHFSSSGDGPKELRITLFLDGQSGTGSMQGIAVKDLPKDQPAGLTVSNITVISNTGSRMSSDNYPNFIIDYGNVSGNTEAASLSTGACSFKQKQVGYAPVQGCWPTCTFNLCVYLCACVHKGGACLWGDQLPDTLLSPYRQFQVEH